MIKVYGLKVSYFTGKLESYLRYKEIPYDYHPSTAKYFRTILREKTGAMQIPAVELDDGRWVTDTSPMIDWFETQYPDHPILPADPVQAFLCRLIEDHADEWMWRPAMHYRWSYPASATLLAREITDEAGKDVRAPEFLKRIRIRRRQYTNFVVKDGVTEETRPQAEHSYTYLLELLSRVFEKRPYLFGDRPTLADIGLMGPMFRHLSMDPDPSRIMRETAPGVMEWVYRLWNARGSRLEGQLVSGVPDDLLPLIKEIGETHLENLCANAAAWGAGKTVYDVTIQGAPYRNVPVSQYRVWCLEKLQERYAALEGEAQEKVTAILEAQGCLEPLLRIAEPGSGYDPDGEAPFGRSIPVYRNVNG